MKKKLFLTIVALILIATSLSSLRYVNALDAVLQKPDVLDVISPKANSKVKGTINIVWKMYDDDQNVIPYTANIFDAQTCEVQNYGQINSNPNGTSSLTQNNVLSWNTKTTLSRGGLADGNYCLKICAALKSGATPYSACNGRNITIINNNSLPVITSIPSKLSIFENESWSYQIKAKDADGDPLSYRFVVKPSWLDINAQSGLITSNNIDKNPSDSDSVKYSVVIAVDDNFSGNVTQQFEITIKKVQTTTPPPPTTPPGPNPNPAPVPPPINSPTEITISSPLKDDLFDEDEFKIGWNITDANGIKKITIQYSQDTEEWNEITIINDISIKEYTWNISELKDGDYFIRLVVVDNLDTQTSKISGEFQIQREEPEVPVESNLLIINTSPVGDSEIEDKLPIIAGEFVPSEGGTIDITSFIIKLDDHDIADKCFVDELGYTCTLDSELSEGRHKVVVDIKDSNNKQANAEWSFIVLGDQTVSAPVDSGPNNNLILIIVVIVIIILLLTIPWVLYILWTRRNKDKGTSKLENKEGATNDNYGYYLPPYNPTPPTQLPTQTTTETVTKSPDSLENYIESFNNQFSTPENQVQANIPSSTITEQAGPKMDEVYEEVKPVMPIEATPLEGLAKEEPKISNAMSPEYAAIVAQQQDSIKAPEVPAAVEPQNLNNQAEAVNNPDAQNIEPLKDLSETNKENTTNVTGTTKESDEFIEPKPTD